MAISMSRIEKILEQIIGYPVVVEQPNSRIEELLIELGEVISGGGGTTDYNDLENKPSINNVTLSGNKTLSDLGIVNPMILKGRVSSVQDLPQSAEVGWLYLVGAATDDNFREYVYIDSGRWEFIGFSNLVIDSELSTTSENPVQNKVVTAAINGLSTSKANQESLDEESRARAAADDAISGILNTKIAMADALGVGTSVTGAADLNSIVNIGRYSWGSIVAGTMANNPLNMYALLAAEPEDWATEYSTKYFTRETVNGVYIYTHVEGIEAPEFVADTYYAITRAIGGTLIVENVQNANRVRQTVIPNDTLAAAGIYYVRFYASSYSGAWSEWFEFKSAKSMFAVMTQAEYDALTTKTADVYFIYEE